MCGRYASFRADQDLLDAFLIDPTHGIDAAAVAAWHASWNVAPTQPVRIVVERAERSLRMARWGLVPTWAADPSVGARMINARAEGLEEKPSFRKALAARRCLVPADGYYEWRKAEPGAAHPRKQPFYIRPADGAVLAFAGLYEFWRDQSRPNDDPDRWLVTCTIITEAATGSLAEIHPRCPVALPQDAWDAWLAPGTSPAQALDLLREPGPDLTWYPVDAQVNAVANDGPELIRPAQQG